MHRIGNFSIKSLVGNAEYFGAPNYFCIGSALRAVNTCNPPTALTHSHGIKSLAVTDLPGYPHKSTASQLQYIYF